MTTSGARTRSDLGTCSIGRCATRGSLSRNVQPATGNASSWYTPSRGRGKDGRISGRARAARVPDPWASADPLLLARTAADATGGGAVAAGAGQLTAVPSRGFGPGIINGVASEIPPRTPPALRK